MSIATQLRSVPEDSENYHYCLISMTSIVTTLIQKGLCLLGHAKFNTKGTNLISKLL